MKDRYGASLSSFVRYQIRFSRRAGVMRGTSCLDGPHGALAESAVASRADQASLCIYNDTKQHQYYPSDDSRLHPILVAVENARFRWVRQCPPFWLCVPPVRLEGSDGSCRWYVRAQGAEKMVVRQFPSLSSKLCGITAGRGLPEASRRTDWCTRRSPCVNARVRVMTPQSATKLVPVPDHEGGLGYSFPLHHSEGP